MGDNDKINQGDKHSCSQQTQSLKVTTSEL